MQNLTARNSKVDSSVSGHCAFDENNMNLANTESRNSDNVLEQKIGSCPSLVGYEKENKQELCMESKSADRSSVTPLSIERLENCRFRAENFFFSIFGNDDEKQVCLELFEKEKELLFSAFFISHDGREIMVFIPKKKIPVSDKPPAVNLKTKKSKKEVKCFTIENLPKKYWEGYQLAKRCVDMRKAVTPKVTIYKYFGKCIMMENTPNPDFEMHYYGYKIKESKSKITIKDEKGVDVTKEGNHEDLLKKFEQMKGACKMNEKYFERNPDAEFPIVVGCRRKRKLKSQDSNKENSSARITQSSLLTGGTPMKSFEVNLNTDSNSSQTFYSKSHSTLLSSERTNTSCNQIMKVLPTLKKNQLEKEIYD